MPTTEEIIRGVVKEKGDELKGWFERDVGTVYYALGQTKGGGYTLYLLDIGGGWIDSVAHFTEREAKLLKSLLPSGISSWDLYPRSSSLSEYRIWANEE